MFRPSLEIDAFPDHASAHNGLQVAGPTEIKRLAVAVDASEAVILQAIESGVDLLLVHHGLFWDGQTCVTGPRFRKLRSLIQGGTALYGCHLPLDAHVEVGNCAVLCREMGWEPVGRFGGEAGREIGWWCEVDLDRGVLVEQVSQAVGGPVRLIAGGPEHVYRIGVVTGAAASLIPDAADFGLDALLTGEGSHHTFNDAMEYRINALYAGHYATETWGVKALGSHLEARFGLSWEFIDAPTGL